MNRLNNSFNQVICCSPFCVIFNRSFLFHFYSHSADFVCSAEFGGRVSKLLYRLAICQLADTAELYLGHFFLYGLLRVRAGHCWRLRSHCLQKRLV